MGHRGVPPQEQAILFDRTNDEPDRSFQHNNVVMSKIIVHDGEIVGLVDRKMAGCFGWRTAAEVHLRVRSPKRQQFAHLDLSDDELDDRVFWNDLYDREQDSQSGRRVARNWFGAARGRPSVRNSG